MRRILVIGATAVALTYFLDPDNGRRRRRAVLAWLIAAAHQVREREATPEEAPIEAAGNGEPSVGGEPPVPMTATPMREPVVIGVAATPEPDEAPQVVAVAERPVAEAEEAVLPPPLPPDVLETPTPEPATMQAEPPAAVQPEPPAAVRESEPPAATRRIGRGWLVVAGVLLGAAVAAAGLALWSFVFDSSDDEPSSSASAINVLAERQARAISIMAQPGATRIPVEGAEESLLLVVGMEGDAVLIVSRLERAPADKTYEIWVISGETPRPAGLFRGGGDTVVPLTRVVPKGATVALTLEPVGGSPQPTTNPLFAVTRT